MSYAVVSNIQYRLTPVERGAVRRLTPSFCCEVFHRGRLPRRAACDLNLVRAEPSGEGTIVTWEEYYEAADLPMMRAEYDDAFKDIAESSLPGSVGMSSSARSTASGSRATCGPAAVFLARRRITR
jgi:hypothetical protein